MGRYVHQAPEDEQSSPDGTEATGAAVPTDDRQRVSIATEDDAWRLLDKILKDEIDADKIVVDLNTATWAAFRIVYKGGNFDQTVPTSAMQGIVDYQLALYRSMAIALRDGRKVSNLTDEEKDAFELVFKVTKGSSDLGANAAEILSEISKAFERMSGKQITICAIVIAVLYFGESGFSNYLTHIGEDKKISLEEAKVKADSENAKGLREIILKLSDNKEHTERERILKDAREQSEKASAIEEEASNGYDSIIRHSKKVEEVLIQGCQVDQRAIRDITSVSRRKSRQTNITSTFTIAGVDSTDPRGFIVKLQNVETGSIVTATLFDAVGREKFGSVIQKAEWGKTRVVVKLAAKIIGEEVAEAKILKAHTERRRRIASDQ